MTAPRTRRLAERMGLGLALALILAACGADLPTPAANPPPIPPSEPMPGTAVEDVVAELHEQGFGCFLDLEGRNNEGWSCLRGDGTSGDSASVSIEAEQTGPISGMSAARSVSPGTETDPHVLDEAGALTFEESLISLVIPEEHRPSDAELLEGVRRNSPMDLGGGWFLGFERDVSTRTVRVAFAPDAP